MARDGFAFESADFVPAMIYLRSAAEDLGRVDYYAAQQVSLGISALSAACEWPARHEFMNTWEDLKQELSHGRREAKRLTWLLEATERGYSTAESGSVDNVLAAVDTSQQVTATVPTPYVDDRMPSSPWSFTIGLSFVAPSLIGRSWVAWEKKQGPALKSDDLRLERYQWRGASAYQLEASKIAERSQATLRNLTYAKAFSTTVAAAALAWISMVVPSDEDLDRAIAGWDSVAYDCAKIFGHDTLAVREAIAASWDGLAKNSAELRLVEFIAAGNHLTERTHRLSAALSDTVRDLNRIHLIALTFSGVSLAAIAGAGIAARFNPALRPVTEFLGTRLSSVILSCVQFIPVAAAGALAWHRAADASRPTTIGDREISGFRRP